MHLRAASIEGPILGSDEIIVAGPEPDQHPQSQLSPRMAGRRVLLIDDDPALLIVMREAFEDEGASVAMATDGRSGLTAFTATPADLVVTDIIMPKSEGVETIIALRRTGLPVKILAISGGGRVDGTHFLMLATSFGADATLAKPFHPQDLADAAYALLRGQAAT